MFKRKYLITIGLIVLMFGACGKRLAKTYLDDQKKVMRAYHQHQFPKALKLADKFVVKVAKKHNQDTFVALLERGKIALDAGAYKTAIKDLQRAEGRFLDIEGTISFSEEASSLFLDDTTKEYEAAPLEKIMISPYLALAYWSKGDFNGARIERNRTITKINQYIESQGPKGKYLENPFARYLSAIIYENENKFNDAKIEYRKIQKTFGYLKTKMKEELNILKKRPKLNDLVVIVDIGKAPNKREKMHKGGARNNRGKFVTVSITYAKYKHRKFKAKQAKVYIDGQEAGITFPLYTLGKTIMAEYKKNEGKLIGKLIARAVLKTAAQVGGQALMKSKSTGAKVAGAALAIFGAASSALERADLRCWVSLPAQVHAFRARNLQPGKHKVQIGYLSGGGMEFGRSKEKEVLIPEGKIGLVHFRIVK